MKAINRNTAQGNRILHHAHNMTMYSQENHYQGTPIKDAQAILAHYWGPGNTFQFPKVYGDYPHGPASKQYSLRCGPSCWFDFDVPTAEEVASRINAA